MAACLMTNKRRLLSREQAILRLRLHLIYTALQTLKLAKHFSETLPNKGLCLQGSNHDARQDSIYLCFC